MLGTLLVVDDPTLGRIVGRIVEVEAYLGEEDMASHARAGRTARNEPMYGDPGHAYLYLVYGMYTCLNVVTEPAGRPAAVLIRAVDLIAGVDAARALRTRHEMAIKRLRDDPAGRARVAERIAATPAARLASGPGLVGASFGLDPSMSGLDLCAAGSRLRLESGEALDPATILASARVGIGYAGEPWASEPWRFAIAGDPAVSRPSSPR